MYLDTEIQQQVLSLSQQLMDQGKMLITAESCTGGLIGAVCTDLAGSSAWFYGGIISYHNEAKMQILKVPAATLDTVGAVSFETVEQMCIGALELGGDISVAVSGVAGPSGGSIEKPVGTVIIGCLQKGEKPQVESFLFEGDRTHIREQTVLTALKKVASLLEKA